MQHLISTSLYSVKLRTSLWKFELSCQIRTASFLLVWRKKVGTHNSRQRAPEYSLTPCLDALVHTRIANDDRVFKRLAKVFNKYASTAYPALLELSPPNATSVEETRDAFLIELSSFQLMLRKNRLVCDAERRQADEYKKEKQRIGFVPTTPFNETFKLNTAFF